MRTGAALLSCLVLSAFAVSGTDSQSSAPSPLQYSMRVLPAQPMSVGVPIATWQLVRAMELLAWHARVPIGFEGLQNDPFEPAESSGELHLGGYSVAEALDKIVAAEPRYRWTEDNGVIHLRPKGARADTDDVLNHAVAAFELHGVTLTQALREVRFYLHPESRGGGIVGAGPAPRQLGLHRFNVTVSDTTVCGLLDAIVIAHGASSWHVTYTNDFRWPYHIGFGTFDGWGTTW